MTVVKRTKTIIKGKKTVLTVTNFHIMGFPGGSDGKVSVCSAGDPGSIAGLGRSSGEGNGSPLQYSCLENPMDGKDFIWDKYH